LSPPHSVAGSDVETNPWYGVDLGVELRVAGVKLTNRADSGGVCVCACVCKLLPRHFLLVQPSGSTVGLHGRIKTKTLDNGISHKG